MNNFIFLSEENLFEDRYKELAVLISGGDEDDWKVNLKKGYIPDLFNLDPDMVNWNGCVFSFMEYNLNGIHHILHNYNGDIEDELPKEVKTAIIALFVDCRNVLEDIPNTWDAFYSRNAIAYRGGSGYSYNIWGIPDNISDYNQLQTSQ